MAVFDDLPLEMVTFICAYLTYDEARGINNLCKMLYQACRSVIWCEAKFYTYVDQIVSFPIKVTFDKYLRDTLYERLPGTLETFKITERFDHRHFTKFNQKVNFIFYTDALTTTATNQPEIYDLLRGMTNLQLTTGKAASRYNQKSLTQDQLLRCNGIPFKKISLSQIQNYNTVDLIDILVTYKIDEICLDSINYPTTEEWWDQLLPFSRWDIYRMRELNITCIGTGTLTSSLEHPWDLLLFLPNLKTIYFAERTVISLYNISEFKFYAVLVSGREYEIDDIQILLNFILNHGCEWLCEGPCWSLIIDFSFHLRIDNSITT